MSPLASLSADVLTLDTGRFRRTFDWNGSLLISRTLELTASDRALTLSGGAPRCLFPVSRTNLVL